MIKAQKILVTFHTFFKVISCPQPVVFAEFQCDGRGQGTPNNAQETTFYNATNLQSDHISINFAFPVNTLEK